MNKNKWQTSPRFASSLNEGPVRIPNFLHRRVERDTDKQNQIIVAHLTDIHVEEAYIEVNKTKLI